jgi:Domain of unknown function (DUF222)/HNH endonuclease
VIEAFSVEPTAGDKMIHNQARIDMLMLEQSRLAAELAESEEWDRAGYNSAYDWIRFNCKVKGNVASDYMSVGRHLPALTKSVNAMLTDEIGFAHLATMADTAAATRRFDESELLPLARENSPGKFYRMCLHYRHAADAAGYNRDQEELREQRYLRLTTAQDGCLLINGALDPVGGAAVRSVLEPLARPSGAHDYRDRDQRMADALEESVCGTRPAHLQVTATIETLKGLAGSGAGEMEFSLPVSGAAVQRMACDCSVTRVLLDQDSMIIDVGRAKPRIVGATRKALKLRDQHCRWPGCERPASFCDGHHLNHWIDGGETNLDNLVLLCRRHHRMVHEGGWRLIKTEDASVMVVAPTVTFGLPRGPD